MYVWPHTNALLSQPYCTVYFEKFLHEFCAASLYLSTFPDHGKGNISCFLKIKIHSENRSLKLFNIILDLSLRYCPSTIDLMNEWEGKFVFRKYCTVRSLKLSVYERLHPKRSTSYPQRWKKSRAYILYYNPPNIGANMTVLMRAFKWYVIWPALILLWWS